MTERRLNGGMLMMHALAILLRGVQENVQTCRNGDTHSCMDHSLAEVVGALWSLNTPLTREDRPVQLVARNNPLIPTSINYRRHEVTKASISHWTLPHQSSSSSSSTFAVGCSLAPLFFSAGTAAFSSAS